MLESVLQVPHPHPERYAPVLCAQALAQQITGRSRRTVQRWIRHGRITDPMALCVLQRELHGLLPGRFTGWRVIGDSLHDPDGNAWVPADLRAAAINAQLVRMQRARIALLESELATLKAELLARPVSRLLRAAKALQGR